MNADQVIGKWKQLSGELKAKWGKITEDDLTIVNGKSELIIGKLQERYGYSKEVAKKEFEDFISKSKFS